MQLLDPAHPFFAPLWRRVAIVAVALAWAVVEFATGAPFWGILFGSIGLYCAWQFFIAFEARTGASHEQDRKEDP